MTREEIRARRFRAEQIRNLSLEEAAEVADTFWKIKDDSPLGIDRRNYASAIASAIRSLMRSCEHLLPGKLPEEYNPEPRFYGKLRSPK